MDPRWGKGEGGMNRRSSKDTYTLPRVKQIAGGEPRCSAGSTARGSVMTREEQDGGWLGDRLERDGLYVYL